MPAFPMNGRSQDHLDSGAVFDVRRTPSQAGLLTEIFRRTPGAVRSLHPTHSVTARGPAAEHITRDHERSATPFDEHSPFQRMLDAEADILCIGTFAAMTFHHLADHLIQDRLPYPIYSGRPTAARIVDRDRSAREIVTEGHNPRLDCEHTAVLEGMAQAGRLRRARTGRVSLFLVSAPEYVAAYHRAQADGLVRYAIAGDRR
jgi:aminoglycoside N3'-acetyltransferase